MNLILAVLSQQLLHVLPRCFPAGYRPAPFGIVKIFDARAGYRSAIEERIIDIRPQSGGAVASRISFKPLFGRDPIGEHARRVWVRRFVRKREEPRRAVNPGAYVGQLKDFDQLEAVFAQRFQVVFSTV